MSKKSQSTQLQCRFTSNPLLTSWIYYFLMFLTLLLVFDFTSIYLFVISLPFILFPPSFSPSINFSFSIYLPVKTLKNSRKSHPHTHTQSNPTQNAQIQVTLILPKIHSLSVLKTLQKSNRQPKLTARNFLKTTSHDIN